MATIFGMKVTTQVSYTAQGKVVDLHSSPQIGKKLTSLKCTTENLRP